MLELLDLQPIDNRIRVLAPRRSVPLGRSFDEQINHRTEAIILRPVGELFDVGRSDERLDLFVEVTASDLEKDDQRRRRNVPAGPEFVRLVGPLRVFSLNQQRPFWSVLAARKNVLVPGRFDANYLTQTAPCRSPRRVAAAIRIATFPRQEGRSSGYEATGF